MAEQFVGANPTVIIGLGGTGKNVLMRVRREIAAHYGALEHLPIVSFLSIDTDDAPSGVPERFLGLDLALRPEEKLVLDTAHVPPILANLGAYPHLAEWFPPELAGIQDLKSGAKQIRALGRLAFFLSYPAIKAAVTAKVRQVTDRDRAQVMRDRHGVTTDSGVNVFVVASLCGGTGSGMLLDLPYALRHWFRHDQLLGEVNGLFLLPGAFEGVGDRVKANAYACLKELNHYMGMGRADGPRFQARYGASELDAVDLAGPPFHFCYMVGDQNKSVDAARLDDLEEMTAQKIALEFTSNFARYAKSNRSNLEGVWHVSPRDAFGQPQNYMAFGLSTLRFPVDRVRAALSARLARTLVKRWRAEGAAGDRKSLDSLLMQRKWLETATRTPLRDALLLGPNGRSLPELLDAELARATKNLDTKTEGFKRNLHNVDAMLWAAHVSLKELTRAHGRDVSRWGELARPIFENASRLRKQLESGIAEAVVEAAEDPARGVRHALWLLDALRAHFEAERERYLEVGRALGTDVVSEAQLHEFLARFDPMGEDMLLHLTGQRKGRFEASRDEFLALLKQHHLAALEAKLRELGAWAFGKALEGLPELRGRLERLELLLGACEGTLASRESEIVAETLALEHANTLYLFAAGDLDTLYAERFADSDAEAIALSQLSERLLAPHGGLLGLAALEHESDREALVQTLCDAAAPVFDEGPQAFKLDRVSVAERFLTSVPDTARRQSMLAHLEAHANPFIHLDGKQVAHKFALTPVQKVVGLHGADQAQPERAVAELLRVLSSACHVAPTHIKPNPDRHTLVLLQEFGVFPLRVVKGLEGYKAYYEHFRDQHLHTMRAADAFEDLFPPDEAKLAEAQRALVLGVALGLLVTEDGALVFHHHDAAGLADTVSLGRDEQSGISTLVADDAARTRLVSAIDTLAKGLTEPERRARYAQIVRYAKAMEAALGTRHPRYQAQRAILGRFIQAHLPIAPGGSEAVSPEAASRYEALFAHYWVDRVIDADERANLQQVAQQLGLPADATRAIETRLKGG